MQVDQIPSGYKLTEVGIIPNDWDVVKLGDIGECIIGLTYKPEDVKESGLLVLRSSNIKGNSLKFDDNVFVNITVPEKLMTKAGDILICVRNGSKELIGKSAMINKKSEKMTFGAFMSVYRSQYSNFIFHIFQSNLIKRQIQNNLGATINQITNKDLYSFAVPLPPIEEQKRIAQVLSDIDELIRSLDELIIKKRNIKQGTMQLLLTGKQRLPGYSGEWEVKTFDDCFKFLTTGSNARSDLSESGEVKYIHYGDIHAKKLPILDCAKDFIPGIARNKVKNLPLLEDGDLIIADASEDYQGLGKSIEIKNVNNCEIVAGLHTLLLRADKLVLADGFKAYITSIESVKNALIKIATGISVFGISKKAIKSIQLFLPPLEEQKAIARILSDMDEEIEVLEQKRNKYQDIKKGMMQELLTGKTRLV